MVDLIAKGSYRSPATKELFGSIYLIQFKIAVTTAKSIVTMATTMLVRLS